LLGCGLLNRYWSNHGGPPSNAFLAGSTIQCAGLSNCGAAGSAEAAIKY
jgi:hypothetical protein